MEANPMLFEDQDATRPRSLLAGPFSLVYDNGDLRRVTWGGREVIRRIYAAVRDPDWDTIPGVLSDLKVRASHSGFDISYLCTHRQGGIHFVWNAAIHGTEEGTVRFVFDGEARSTFHRNRIGFCVLHPIRECAGTLCQARYANGTERLLRFPQTIAAEQPVKWFHDLAALAHEVAPGLWAEVEFSGDLYEMEDQRNWIDASFKTFCTPLRLPFPMEIQAGTRIRQEIKLALISPPKPTANTTLIPAATTTATAPALSFETRTLPPVPAPVPLPTVAAKGVLSQTPVRTPVLLRWLDHATPLPLVGLGLASHGQPLRATEANRLRQLRPAHLRVDLRLWDPAWPHDLARAALDAGLIHAPLEVALHLDSTPTHGLAQAVDALAQHSERIARLLLFHRHQKSTTPAALHALRTAFTGALGGVPIAVGTDADLYQLNLQRPPADADGICWSMNPQVHAFDDLSIAETPEAVAHQLESVRSYFPGKTLVVSPVTLRPRFNPNATGPEPAVPPGELPPQVDPRQVSLFAAGWTLAMLKALAESGAHSVTFYETTGWRGVMGSEQDSTLPAKFPSIHGAVFPLYHVLADLGDFAGGEVVHTQCNQPVNVASLGLRHGRRRRWMVANLSPDPCLLRFENTEGASHLRTLDASTHLSAMTSPEEFHTRSAPFSGTELELGPHALVTLEFNDL